MTFVKQYRDGVYEVVQYTSGGSIIDNLTGDIIADWSDFWTDDNSIHPETKKQIDFIESEFGLKIHLR
jgi:hypothetical protein